MSDKEYDLSCGLIQGWLLAKDAPAIIMEAIDYLRRNELLPSAPHAYKTEPRKEITIEKVIEVEMRQECDAEPEKQRKPRKPLSPENRAALIARLAKAREKKLQNQRNQ